MRIIERFCRGKHADQSLNEDGLVVTEDFAAVVDGVTGKSLRHPWKPSGGVVAKDLLASAIAGLPGGASMREAQRTLDGRLRNEYARFAAVHGDVTSGDASSRVFEVEPWERLQANAVVYSVRRGEVWLFGDCQVMVDGVQVPTLKRVDELLGKLRSFAARALALRADAETRCAAGQSAAESGGSVDPARDLIMPFLRLQTEFANRRGEYGYFVFDGFTDPEYPIHVVPVEPGAEVVLASDGYPLLRSTLAGSEAELERLRHEDPGLVREYRSTKGFTAGLGSFDDRTYLRFIA
ncbi:hypothetical protein [Bifidobacterium platyrrhinorum]|uniref:Uncharacterized protein n=1 Tax=Bifidobacterium platyrrhinorum TaxID=2661628 RepID=A0A6L9SPW5_9BIFI|nr:hypothetical protein [Bifidobacterium platyrrhinorum]NEG54566.1 hypothetical protein [Bifidobacterium platyrrhinorum]